MNATGSAPNHPSRLEKAHCHRDAGVDLAHGRAVVGDHKGEHAAMPAVLVAPEIGTATCPHGGRAGSCPPAWCPTAPRAGGCTCAGEPYW